jgi:hypothetical protein
MIGESIAAFGGSSVITAVLTVIIKMWDKKLEADERKTMLLADASKMDIRALDAIASRTNNLWGNLSRFILLIVPQIVILAMLWIGYHSPDVVIWYGEEREPWKLNLFGLIELTGATPVTWRQFSGIVLVPTIFAQAGATMSYFLIGGMMSRR